MKKRFLKFWEVVKKRPFWSLMVFILVITGVTVVPGRIESYLEGPAGKYETTTVKKDSIRQTLSASGEVVAENQVTLKFQTSGQLAWVGVKEGDRVGKWQAIASLDKRELKKKIEKELNDYLSERWDFEQELEDYEIDYFESDKLILTNEIRRILEKAQFDLNNAVIDVEIADLTEKWATLITPIAGIVTNIEEPVAGVNITPATAEFTVADPAKMKFIANVDETEISQVRLGQNVIIALDAYPEEEFEGKVSQIAFAAVSTSGGGTAFPVEIFLPPNEEDKFRIGMNGDVEIILGSKEETLVIPLETIQTKNGQFQVQIIENREVKTVTIKTGLESDLMVEVKSGLKEGQTVVVEEKKKK